MENNKNAEVGCLIMAAIASLGLGFWLLNGGSPMVGIALIVCGGIALAAGIVKTAKAVDGNEDDQPRRQAQVRTASATPPTFECSIKGINKSGIDDTFLGDHEGIAWAEDNNLYDPYAIGVYVGRKRVGYFPAGSKDIHEYIMSRGGTIPVCISIYEGYDDGHLFYFGKVSPK